MSDWDKLWEGWGGGYYDHPPIYKVRKVGDKMQEQVLFLQATVKAQADLLDKYQSSPTTAKEG